MATKTFGFIVGEELITFAGTSQEAPFGIVMLFLPLCEPKYFLRPSVFSSAGMTRSLMVSEAKSPTVPSKTP